MDFVIIGTAGSELSIDQNVLEGYLSQKQGVLAAMQYRSAWNKYKAGSMTITTDVSLIISQIDGSLTAATSKQVTQFHFPDPSIVTRGATKRATAIIKDCIDLAQAHAYGHFMYKAASFKIEFLPSAVLPIERYEDEIKSFLRKISKI
ncbi:hypothetical protein IQ277_29310 [Nostocales cyanobacterium LEGE 12452]|nr:hypothetical protein [Nostocales cyanobacterium LEGE 12452]